MPIFISYRLIDSLKTCASIGNPPPQKKASYPYFRHGNAVYTNNLENFVQKIFSISKNLCTFAAAVELKFHQFKWLMLVRHGHSWEPPCHFCFLQTPQFSKDLRVYCPPPKKESSYPYSRHGFTIYTNNRPLAVENFVQNIWLCKKFFVPLQRTKRTRVNLCSFRFVSIKQDYGMATRERRLCLVLIKDETGKKKL